MLTRAFFITLGVILILYLYRNIKKNQLSENESILWIIGAIVILVLAIWPELIMVLANAVGIDYAPSLLFLLANLFLLILCFRNSRLLSVLKEKNKELIQNSALLEERIRRLENKYENRN